MGFCWSESLYVRGATIVGCTLAALAAAQESAISFVLGGGAHHSFRGKGRGFCIFNDIACAALEALRHAGMQRVAVLDCDVHQGDGTASILGTNPAVFSCSIHGAKNYPFQKEQSSLDIELEDDCGDDRYASAVSYALERVAGVEPDLLIYVAGADPYREDALGRLRVSAEVLRERDEQVFRYAHAAEVPTLVVFGGGYCSPIDPTVALNLQTIEVAYSIFETAR